MMEHTDLYLLRETYNRKNILLCFNGPFSQGLIEEIGTALRKHIQSETASSTSALDVFAVYIEIAQNIREYSATREYSDAESSATVVISRDEEGRYSITAGNIVEAADGETLVARINALAEMDKAQLKAAYKKQLRQPRADSAPDGAGLGLIDIARKASAPISCALRPVSDGAQLFFSLQVVI
jgi:hypothetical protein